MKQESNNALLPPMEWENFQQTELYHLLFIRQQYRKAVYRFLHVANLKELEYVPNPESVPYTPYGQEDFDEICDFLEYNGMEEKDNALPSYFRLLSTNVGKFVVYQPEGIIQGILNRR